MTQVHEVERWTTVSAASDPDAYAQPGCDRQIFDAVVLLRTQTEPLEQRWLGFLLPPDSVTRASLDSVTCAPLASFGHFLKSLDRTNERRRLLVTQQVGKASDALPLMNRLSMLSAAAAFLLLASFAGSVKVLIEAPLWALRSVTQELRHGGTQWAGIEVSDVFAVEETPVNIGQLIHVARLPLVRGRCCLCSGQLDNDLHECSAAPEGMRPSVPKEVVGMAQPSVLEETEPIEPQEPSSAARADDAPHVAADSGTTDNHRNAGTYRPGSKPSASQTIIVPALPSSCTLPL